MKLVAAVILISLGAGCIGGSKKPGLVAGGAVAALGMGMIMSTQRQDCSSMPFDDAIGCGAGEVGTAVLGTYAILAGLGILTLTAIIPTPQEDPPEPIPRETVEEVKHLAIVEPPTTEPMLRQLTIQASVAARGGRCLTVQAIAHRIDEMDRAYRYTGFINDPLIAACLQ